MAAWTDDVFTDETVVQTVNFYYHCVIEEDLQAIGVTATQDESKQVVTCNG